MELTLMQQTGIIIMAFAAFIGGVISGWLLASWSERSIIDEELLRTLNKINAKISAIGEE
jgi:hypothetical protein